MAHLGLSKLVKAKVMIVFLLETVACGGDKRDAYSIDASSVTKMGDKRMEADLVLNVEFLPSPILLSNAPQSLKLGFDLSITVFNDVNFTDQLYYVLLAEPEDLQVDVGGQSFLFNGKQEWEDCILTIDCLRSSMTLDVDKGAPIDQLTFTLFGQEPLSMVMDMPELDPALSVNISDAASPENADVLLSITDTITPIAITTQLVAVSENEGQPMLDDEQIQSRCNERTTPFTSIALDTPLQFEFNSIFDGNDCPTYNSALVRLEYSLPGQPEAVPGANDFDFTLLTSSSRFTTEWLSF